MPGICVAVKATTRGLRVVAIDHVEVVEIAPGGAHDHHPLLLHRGLLFDGSRAAVYRSVPATTLLPGILDG